MKKQKYLSCEIPVEFNTYITDDQTRSSKITNSMGANRYSIDLYNYKRALSKNFLYPVSIIHSACPAHYKLLHFTTTKYLYEEQLLCLQVYGLSVWNVKQ
jgi:hypothetical protein